MASFKCSRCGACCRSLDRSALYADLDRGDGVCRYLDEKSNLCTIYGRRPLKCNVDRMYELYFCRFMSREAYEAENYKMCRLLAETVKNGRK